jgi:hypothetical protein
MTQVRSIMPMLRNPTLPCSASVYATVLAFGIQCRALTGSPGLLAAPLFGPGRGG